MYLCSICPSSSPFSIHSFHLPPFPWFPRQSCIYINIYSCPIIIIITTIILCLISSNEWEREFGLFILTYQAQCNDLQFFPLSCKSCNFIFLYRWVMVCVCVCVCMLCLYTCTIYIIFSLHIHHLLDTTPLPTIWLL
jgi:hypothetical protein